MTGKARGKEEEKIGIIFSKFVYMENIDRDVILLRQNVVASSGITVIRPTRLDL